MILKSVAAAVGAAGLFVMPDGSVWQKALSFFLIVLGAALWSSAGPVTGGEG